MSQDRVYDPAFAAGSNKVTIMDVANDHAQRQRYCGCSLCEMARIMEKQRIRREEKAVADALTERLMKEWP